MNEKILSVRDCQEIMTDLSEFSSHIENFYNQFEEAIKQFNNNSIVQSFYESGTFGKEKEEELINLRNAVKKYMDVINSDSDSLIPKTKKIVSDQMNLLSTGIPSSVREMMNSKNENISRMEGLN